MSDTQDVIVRLLRTIGGRKEVEQYLRHYCGADQKKFAVVRIGRGIGPADRGTVATALGFLQRVGLRPIVVHGAGPGLRTALEKAGIELPRHGDGRMTTARGLDLIRRVYQDENLALVEALNAQRCAARPVSSGVFEAAQTSFEQGLVGTISGIDKTAIEAAIRAKQLPIVSCLATSASGQLLDVSADEAAAALAEAFDPHKVIFLTPRGGLLDRAGELISAINLSEDQQRITQRLDPEEDIRFGWICKLLDALKPDASVSVTSPDHLARELFTHRGAGTLIRRGELVVCHDDVAAIDRGRLRALLESCFSKALSPTYFDDKKWRAVYVSEAYRATAIITTELETAELDVGYLDKFAVTHKAQGEGLGGSVWQRVRADHKKLFWRAKTSNSVNSWYFQQADGSYKTADWTVFWYGIHDFAEIEQLVKHALLMPATFDDDGQLEGT